MKGSKIDILSNFLSNSVPGSLGLGWFLGCLPAVNHPRDAESIDQHTKSHGPECFPEWHRHGTVFHQSVKYALGLYRVLNANVDVEAMRFLVAIWRGVHPHQYLAADYQTCVNDLASPFRRHLVRDRRALMGHHGVDFAAEALLIELERVLTLPVEMEVGIKLHGGSPLFNS